jgi:hypothetical protein
MSLAAKAESLDNLGQGEMNASELKPGIIVRGPVLPEPIEVLVVTPLG